MLEDFKTTFKNWRLIHLLGVSNLRSRYSRSKLGQIWLTLSLFIQIASSAIVWSILWHFSLKEFIPYVAIGQTVYQFFFMTIQDATGIFVNDARLYINQSLPFLTSVLSSLYKNIIIFLHNVPIILIALFVSNKSIYWSINILLIIPVALLFLISVSYFLACICTRYRDVTQVISSLLNISFLVTPILWKIDSIPEHLRGYFYINPLASFLEIIRNPLLGNPDVNPMAYTSLILWTMMSILFMFGMYHRFNKRIILWV